jgi:hypothetical protein
MPGPAHHAGEWEEVLSRDAPGLRYTAWRRPAPCGGGLSEWRATTVYEGVTAADVAAFQLDAPRRREWDAGVDAFAPLDDAPLSSSAGGAGGSESGAVPTAPGDAPLSEESQLQFWRMRYPAPFAPRDYVCARRVWRTPPAGAAAAAAAAPAATCAAADDTTTYIVAKAPPGPLRRDLELAIPCGRAHRVRTYYSGIRVRAVPGGAELTTLYYEDCGLKPSMVEFTVRRSLWGFVEKQAAALHAYVPSASGGAGMQRGGAPTQGHAALLAHDAAAAARPRKGRFGVRAALRAARGVAVTYVAAAGRAAVAALAANAADGGAPRRMRTAGSDGALAPPSPRRTPRSSRSGSAGGSGSERSERGGAHNFDPVAALCAPLRGRLRVGASIRRRAAAAFAAGANHVAAESARRAAAEADAAEPAHQRRRGGAGGREGGALRGKLFMVAAAIAVRVLRRGALTSAAAAAAGREAGRALRMHSVHGVSLGNSQ